MGNEGAEFGDAGLGRRAGFFQVEQALADVEFQAGQQKLERRGHELARKGFGQFAAAAQAVVEFDFGAGLLQFVVFHHMVHVANGDQNCDPGYD